MRHKRCRQDGANQGKAAEPLISIPRRWRAAPQFRGAVVERQYYTGGITR